MKKIYLVDPEAVTERVEIKEGMRRTFQVVHCSEPGCTHTLEFSVVNTLKPVAVLMNYAKQKGWRIFGNKYKNRICPLHQTKKEEPMATQLTRPKEARIEPSEAAKVQRRKVFFAIDEAYDKNHYLNGMTDEIIAEKLGVAVTLVRTIREENFNPAGENPEITEMKSLLRTIEGQLKLIEDQYLSQLVKIDKMTKDLTEQINELRTKIETFEQF